MSINDFHSLLRTGALRSLVDVATGARKQLDDGSDQRIGWNEW